MGDLHILPALLREDLRELVDVAGGVGESAQLEPGATDVDPKYETRLY